MEHTGTNKVKPVHWENDCHGELDRVWK